MTNHDEARRLAEAAIADEANLRDVNGRPFREPALARAVLALLEENEGLRPNFDGLLDGIELARRVMSSPLPASSESFEDQRGTLLIQRDRLARTVIALVHRMEALR